MSLFDGKSFDLRSINMGEIVQEMNNKESDPNKRKVMREDRMDVNFENVSQKVGSLKSSCTCFEITEEDFKKAFPKTEAEINDDPVQVMEIDDPVPAAPKKQSPPTFIRPNNPPKASNTPRITARVTISDDEEEAEPPKKIDFKSAYEIWEEDNAKNNRPVPFRQPMDNPGPSTSHRDPNTFPPGRRAERDKLKGFDPELVAKIENEGLRNDSTKYTWDDIAGLEYPKSIIQETVVLPQLRPDLFTGLRRPPKGILLFGPPGTGKTLIGKCIASQSQSKFYSISASALTSKWIGEGEKLVRTLFAVASANQPSVVFIDEIDSLLSKRSDKENECSRKMKTEFMIAMDGATTKDDDRVLLIGATNRPQELDDAIRRRLTKRLYIPLPDEKARLSMLKRLLAKEGHNLTEDQLASLAQSTTGFSGSDMKDLAKEAAFQVIRSFTSSQLQNVQKNEVRPLGMGDFLMALKRAKPTVDQSSLDEYVQWDKTFGCGAD